MKNLFFWVARKFLVKRVKELGKGEKWPPILANLDLSSHPWDDVLMPDSLGTKPRRQQWKQHKYDQKGAWEQGRRTSKNSEQGKHLFICYQTLSNHPAWHDSPEGKKYRPANRAVSLQIPLASLKGLYGVPTFGFTEHPFFSERGEESALFYIYIYISERGTHSCSIYKPDPGS